MNVSWPSFSISRFNGAYDIQHRLLAALCTSGNPNVDMQTYGIDSFSKGFKPQIDGWGSAYQHLAHCNWKGFDKKK